MLKKMRLFLLALMVSLAAGAVWALDFSQQTTPLVPPSGPTDPSTITPPPTASGGLFTAVTEEVGLLGWRRPAAINLFYQLTRNNQFRLFELFSATINFTFNDPWQLGNYLGLAEDALEYQLGTGLAVGLNSSDTTQVSLPLEGAANLYWPEKSLFGLNPLVGLALDYNLLAEGWKIGGIGAKLYGGFVTNFSLTGEKAVCSFGYGSYRIANTFFTEGFFVQLSQPLVL